MDDIGNLIYVLIFVIWFLFRVFGSGKKQVQKPLPPIDETASVPTKQDAPRPVTFEDILRELTGTPPEPKPVKQPEPEFTYTEPETEVSYSDSEYGETDAYKTEVSPPTAASRTSESGIKVVMERTGSTPGFHAARDVRQMLKSKKGLRKAIILKEILDRPYQ